MFKSLPFQDRMRPGVGLGLMMAALVAAGVASSGAATAGPLIATGSSAVAGRPTLDLVEVQYRGPRRGPHSARRGRSSTGAVVAAGVAGLVIGGLIASQAQASPRYQTYETYDAPAYPPPRYVYEEPSAGHERYGLDPYDRAYPAEPLYRSRPVERRYVVQQSFGYRPWTPEWYDYCSRRYRSFDPSSGTFMGYNGIRQMC